MSIAPARVTVVVPTYNSAAFLGRALDSLLAQTVRDWRAVVIDNCSADRSHDIAREYAARDPRFLALRNDRNIGPVGNWRAGLARAETGHAALLFSDDWYEPGFLETGLAALCERKCDVFVSPVNRRAEGSTGALEAGSAVLFGELGAPTIPTTRFLELLLLPPGHAAVPVSPGCALFRRELLVEALALRLPDPCGCDFANHGAGPDLWCFGLAALRAREFATSPVALVNFVHRAGAESMKPKAALGYLWAKRLLLDALPAGDHAWQGRAGGRWWRQALRVSLRFPKVLLATLKRERVHGL